MEISTFSLCPPQLQQMGSTSVKLIAWSQQALPAASSEQHLQAQLSIQEPEPTLLFIIRRVPYPTGRTHSMQALSKQFLLSKLSTPLHLCPLIWTSLNNLIPVFPLQPICLLVDKGTSVPAPNVSHSPTFPAPPGPFLNLRH